MLWVVRHFFARAHHSRRSLTKLACQRKSDGDRSLNTTVDWVDEFLVGAKRSANHQRSFARGRRARLVGMHFLACGRRFIAISLSLASASTILRRPPKRFSR